MRRARPDRLEDLPAALEQLGLEPPLKTLVVVGGAERMSLDEMTRARPVIEVLGDLAERVGAVFVDGGTDEGVMRLLGHARARGRNFPLVGVVVASLAVEPEATPTGEQANLEPNHTHVMLVPGEKWGDEVVWIARVADVLAGAAPSATVIVNGGDIAYADAAASIASHRPVLAIDGTGRTADAVAAACRGEQSDERAESLAASALVQAIGVRDNQLVELEHVLCGRS
jgi:SLOG in TRPM, prokaryote